SYVESRDFAVRRAQAEHIAFLTHELRNPLGAATLGASQIRRIGALAPMQAQMVDRLDRSHARLRDLIDNVLATERFEAGRVDVCLVETTLGEVLQAAV